MSLHPVSNDSSGNTSSFRLILEILPEDLYETDPAAVSIVGSTTVDALLHDGYIVQPVYTGQRGGPDILLEIITRTTTFLADAWVHKELYERILTDASSLVAVCNGIIPVLKAVLHAHKKHIEQTGTPPASQIKLTVEIDSIPISVEAASIEQAEAALKLAQHFHTNHPTAAARVTAQSKVKVKVSIPKKQKRKRR